MRTDIIYDNYNTASNRYYDSKSSVQYRYVEVIRPVVEVIIPEQGTIEICKAEVQRNSEVAK